MKNLLKRIYSKLKRINQWKPRLVELKSLLTIGTRYGGWTIPDNFLSEESIVYLAGAGEDISFDVGIAEKYGSLIYIFDPTPRAKMHFDLLINGISRNQKVSINNSKTDFYKISKKKLERLHFIELGLWYKKDELKFYSPKNPEHVSHSIINLQKTENYFKAKVDRLSNIMKQLNHKQIDLLKIDIEGAEYKVIESILTDKIRIKVLCVEYDEAYNPLDNKYLKRIKKSVSSLLNYGYKIVDADSNHNYTFILQQEYEKLKAHNNAYTK